MEKDLSNVASLDGAISENDFDYFQKGAAIAPQVCYNGYISQNDLGCELQAKEGVLV